MKKILIVEDDKEQRNSIQESISKWFPDYECEGIGRIQDMEKMSWVGVDIVLLDRDIRGKDAWDWVCQKKQEGIAFPCIILMSGRSDVFRVQEYEQKLNATSVSKEKPEDFFQRMETALSRILKPPRNIEDKRQELMQFYDQVYSSDNQPVMVGIDQSMMEVLKTIHCLAGKNIHVLVTGESGTGKELVAKALHEQSKKYGKRPGHLITANLSERAESLIEDELFGHTKGAFTNATWERQGLLKRAHEGTLFLDEIGDISPNIQVKLLRVIQEKEFTPLGADHSDKVDICIVAATNKDLSQMVDKGKFRQDLYYRLAAAEIRLPPLRERSKKEFDLLVEHCIRDYEKEMQMKTGTYRLDREVYEVLQSQNWPGNIRQLKFCLNRLLAMSGGDNSGSPMVMKEHLPAELKGKFSAQNMEHISQFLQKVVEQEPIEISYGRIEKLQEELEFMLLKRLFDHCGREWEELVKKTNMPESPARRRNAKMKRIYERLTGEKTLTEETNSDV